MPETLRARLAANLHSVHERIAAVCARTGRSPEEIRLVAVTKYSSLQVIETFLSLGSSDLGENRPQQLIERAEHLQSSAPALPVNWHLIGQLQRNKVRAVLPFTTLIHSVDSLRLAQRISQVASELQLSPRILLEVNVGEEPAKSGFTAAELRNAWESLISLPSMKPAGLMTMAPHTSDRQLLAGVFSQLRELRDELQARSSEVPLTELSMGMSNDFEVAIEQGATLIRLGTVLFEGTESLT